MDHQFIVTPEDIYKFILAVAGFIVSVAAASKVITDAVNKAKEPDKVQNERISLLDTRVTALEKNQEMFKRNQRRAEKAWVIYMEALLELTNHMIDGNHIENLKAVRNKMQCFITENSSVMERSEDDEQ